MKKFFKFVRLFFKELFEELGLEKKCLKEHGWRVLYVVPCIVIFDLVLGALSWLLFGWWLRKMFGPPMGGGI
jgi:hypothetical protein